MFVSLHRIEQFARLFLSHLTGNALIVGRPFVII
jgi:hypothetical protein